eukprot:4140419-Amphidinium_carterae.3
MFGNILGGSSSRASPVETLKCRPMPCEIDACSERVAIDAASLVVWLAESVDDAQEYGVADLPSLSTSAEVADRTAELKDTKYTNMVYTQLVKAVESAKDLNGKKREFKKLVHL